MASNRHFLLAPGDYDLNALDNAINPAYFDGRLINLENVVIEGSGVEQVDFFTRSTGVSVISIQNCSGITLKHLNLGHDPLPGFSACEEGVVYLREAGNIVIEDCTLFGCGTVGIYARESENLTCLNSLIRDCSLNIMELYGLKNAVFEGCEFISEENQAIRIFNHENILFRDSRLTGLFAEKISVYINDVNIFDLPDIEDADKIEDREVNGVRFVNVAVEGNPLVSEIEALHEGLSATLSEFAPWEQRIISCRLFYSAPLEEKEYLKQLKSARDMILANMQETDSVIIYVEWPGIDWDIMMSYYENIYLRSNYSDIAKVMDDGRAYLSWAEAEEVFRQWLPQVLKSDGTEIVEEVYSLELRDAIIVSGEAYYFVMVTSDQLKFQETYKINAFNGALGMYFENREFAPIKYASPAEINAVLEYLRANGEGYPEDSCFRAFIVNEKYLVFRSGSDDRRFMLNKENGKITVTPFYEFEGD